MAGDCLFCKIVRGEIPSARVLETDRAVAFLDLHPVNHGHVLIVPKAHHASLLDLTEEDAAHVASRLPGLCRAIVAATGAEAFNVVVNNGPAAGQTIFHGHWHIIPRFADDAVRWPWPHQSYADDAMAAMQAKILEKLSV